MKKTLLTLITALAAASALPASAETVTIHYYTDKAGTNETLMVPTESEVTDNGDGTITVANYMNSTVDIKLPFGKTLNTLKIEPLGGWYQANPGSFSALYNDDFIEIYEGKESNKIARFHIVKKDTYNIKYNGEEITITDPEFAGGLYVEDSQSKCEMTGEDNNYEYYRYTLRTYLSAKNSYQTVENVPATTYTSGLGYAYSIFDVKLPKAVEMISFVDGNGAAVLNDVKRELVENTDKSITLNNFANSGVALGFKFGSMNDKCQYTLIPVSGVEAGAGYQPLAGATSALTATGGAAVNGAVSVDFEKSYAEIVSSNFQEDELKINLATKYGDVECFTTCKWEGKTIVGGEPTDIKVIDPYTGQVYSTLTMNLEKRPNGTHVIYNLLNSGYNLAFKFGEREDNVLVSGTGEGTDKPAEYFSRHLLTYDEALPATKAVTSITLTLGDNSTTDFTGIDGDNIKSTTMFFYSSASSRKRYYPNDEAFDGKDRVNYHIYFCAAFPRVREDNTTSTYDFYMLNWDEFPEGSLGNTGVAEIAAPDQAAPVEWYNLQGIRVSADALTPGIYIRRQGPTTTKVLVK